MITLAPLSSTHQNELSYEPGDEQMQFTVLPKDWLDDERADAYKVVILDDDLHQVVEFFVLDIGQDKYRCTDNPNAVLLRSMSINPVFQGKGYAKRALEFNRLKNFCQSRTALCDEIVLGVNHANVSAQRLYEKIGFIRQARTVMGQKGKQGVYCLKINRYLF